MTNFKSIVNTRFGFQTNDLLASGSTYDSGVLSIEKHTQVQTHILSDVDGTILIQFCRDDAGADILRSLTIPYVGGSGFQVFAAPAFTPFVRYQFTADEAGQSDFYFDTRFLNTAITPQILTTDAFISPLMTSQLTRSVIVGKDPGGNFKNVSISPVENNLQVDLPRGAFGEIATVQSTPVVQGSFIYNINTDIFNLASSGGGTSTQASAMAILQTDTSANSYSEVTTKRYLKYRPGQGAHLRGTAIFTTGVSGSEQLFGAGDSEDGLFFGYNGSSFGILTRVNGINTWTPQASWNSDVMDGTGPSGKTLDPTKGNVFDIQFQWLGFGMIRFGIEDETTGRFTPVHKLEFANNNTAPSLFNPSFPIMWRVENTTNTTNITIKGSSCIGEVEGNISYIGPTNSIGNTKTGVTTTLTNIITIRNKSTFQSLTNRTPINILKYSIAVDGTATAEFELIQNATLGGSPTYTDISASTSVVDYDISGTTVSGGTIIDFGSLGKEDSVSVTPRIEDIILLPGETLTIAVNSTAATTVATIGIRWVEDF